MANKKKGFKSRLRAMALAGTSPLIKKVLGRKKAEFGKAYPIKQRKVTKEERQKILQGAAPKKTAPKKKKTISEMRAEEARRIKEAAE